MISREDVINGFRFILGRMPESEGVIEHHMQLPDVETLRNVLLSSQEFKTSNKLIEFDKKWVCAEILDKQRIWLNLSDKYVSYGCLINNYEPSETKFVCDNLKPRQTFVDIGANIGWFTLLAASIVGDDGCVISIEPRSDCYRYLVRSVCDSHKDHIVEHHKCVLSDENGYKEITWVENTNNPGNTYLAAETISEKYETERVISHTLDSIMTGRKCDFIKIDVEGAEPLVFRGAAKLLEECKPTILSEIYPDQLQKVSGYTDKEYIDIMKGYGYNCYILEDGKLRDRISSLAHRYQKELASVVFVYGGEENV